MQTELPDQVLGAWRAENVTPPLAPRAVDAGDFAEIARILAVGEGYTLPAGEASFDAAEVREDLVRRAAEGRLLGLAVCEAESSPLAAFLLHLQRNKLTDAHHAGDVLARLPDDAFPPDGRFLQVFDLWVSPAWRRRGLATALKHAMEAHARALNVACMLTLTEATHAAVLRLNDQLGYRPIYRGPAWDEVERVVLIKRLD